MNRNKKIIMRINGSSLPLRSYNKTETKPQETISCLNLHRQTAQPNELGSLIDPQLNRPTNE